MLPRPGCTIDDCPDQSPPGCAIDISEQVSRGDNPAAGGEFSKISWQSRVYCRNFRGSIVGQSLLVNRTPGHNGEVIAYGPFHIDGGDNPSITSNGETHLFDIDDIGEGPNVVEVMVEAEFESDLGPFISCNEVPGYRIERCDGLFTPRLNMVVGAEPVSAQKPPPPYGARGRIPNGMALTFDDGPHPVWTPKILDRLKEYGVKATFCVVGKEARMYPDLIRRIVDEGHAICNHSDDHDVRLGKEKTPAQIRANILACDAAILAAKPGAQITHFRHPGGRVHPAVEGSHPQPRDEFARLER